MEGRKLVVVVVLVVEDEEAEASVGGMVLKSVARNLEEDLADENWVVEVVDNLVLVYLKNQNLLLTCIVVNNNSRNNIHDSPCRCEN